MYNVEFTTLMATTVRPISIQAARTDIVKLNALKARIERLPQQSLPEIDQVNAITKRIGVINRKIRIMQEEREFTRRDQIRDQREKKDDVFKVKPVQDEVIARKDYKTRKQV